MYNIKYFNIIDTFYENLNLYVCMILWLTFKYLHEILILKYSDKNKNNWKHFTECHIGLHSFSDSLFSNTITKPFFIPTRIKISDILS